MKKLFVVFLLVAMLLSLTACDSKDYKRAKELYASRDYEEALSLFEALGDYEDSMEMVKACEYEIACMLMEAREFVQAAEAFALLEDYEDSVEKKKACNYQTAIALLEKGKFSQAAEAFALLGEYEDSVKQLQRCQLMQIDVQLQGTWKGDSSMGEGIVFVYEFNEGNFKASLQVNGAGIANEGGYRIDLESQSIYVCYDNKYSGSIDDPDRISNDEEQLMFTYTFDGDTLVLESDLCNTVEKQ